MAHSDTPTLCVCNVIEEGRLGGPQVRIAEVAARLEQHNVRTTVVLPRRDSERFTALLKKRGVSFKQLGLHRLTRQRGPLAQYALTFPFEVFGLWRHFHREGYDLIHASGGCWQIKAPLAARLAGIPVLWHLNDTGTPRIVRMIFKALARFCPSGLIVAANRVRGYYVRDLGIEHLPIYEIQAPVDCARFAPGQVLPAKAIAAQEGLSVVMVCSVNPDKGVEHFVRAAARVGKTRPDIRFHVVGPTHASQAGYRRMVDDLVTELGVMNLSFHGPTDDVRPALEAADIYVCSSVREASPMSVWEAMCMSRAIVSTDVGDVARFMRDGESGRIVPPADAEALARGVLDLAGDKDLRSRLGRAARKAVENKLDVEIIAKRHAQVYRDQLALHKHN